MSSCILALPQLMTDRCGRFLLAFLLRSTTINSQTCHPRLHHRHPMPQCLLSSTLASFLACSCPPASMNHSISFFGGNGIYMALFTLLLVPSPARKRALQKMTPLNKQQLFSLLETKPETGVIFVVCLNLKHLFDCKCLLRLLQMGTLREMVRQSSPSNKDTKTFWMPTNAQRTNVCSAHCHICTFAFF